MARCPECTEKVVLPPFDDRQETKTLRTWSSYKELISLARSGCDLCTLSWQYLSHTTITSREFGEGLAMDENKISLKMINHIDPHISLKVDSCYGDVIISSRSGSTHRPRLAPPTDALTQASSLLRDCLSSHKTCNRNPEYREESDSLPRRLLDLSHGSTILVLDVKDWISQDRATAAALSQYCTLSYRWGSAAHDCILKAPFSGQVEYALDSMPQTFQDAIFAARALKVRFLWIDALCIVQPSASGDATDWNLEGPRMGIIYRGALFTIAATCAESADDGFLENTASDLVLAEPCQVPRNRTNGQVRSIILDTTDGKNLDLLSCVTMSNLNRRGWVQQERALSRRLLHFTKHGVFRECFECSAHGYYGKLPQQDDTQLQITRAPSQAGEMKTADWYLFIEPYAYSNFTVPEDRLIALSSVARIVHPMFGKDNEYCAGLWKHDAVLGLMWVCPDMPEGSNTVRLTVAPSWSWASVARRVTFPYTQLEYRPHVLSEVLDIHISPLLANNPYGNIKEGQLKLRGELSNRLLPTKNRGSFPYGATFDDLVVMWDELQDTTKEEDVYTVIVLGAHRHWFTPTIQHTAIILEPLLTLDNGSLGSQFHGTYRRIGLVSYVHSRSWNEWEAKCRDHRREIERDTRTIIIY